MGGKNSTSKFKAKQLKKFAKRIRQSKKPGIGHVTTKKASTKKFVGESVSDYQGPNFHLKKVPAYYRKTG